MNRNVSEVDDGCGYDCLWCMSRCGDPIVCKIFCQILKAVNLFRN
jgi:hypothetical protein